MTRRMYCLALLGIFFLAAPGLAGEERTFEGQFIWERDDGDRDGPLKAHLTPTGNGEWDIEFHFDWEDGPHVYKGTCAGSLEGELSGDVVGDGERQMKFKFSGWFQHGTFGGTHAFVTKEGEIKRAGRMVLGTP